MFENLQSQEELWNIVNGYSDDYDSFDTFITWLAEGFQVTETEIKTRLKDASPDVTDWSF